MLTFGELSQSPLGPISVAAGNQGLMAISYQPLGDLKQKFEDADQEPALASFSMISTFIKVLYEYINGKRKVFSTAIEWNMFRGFQKDVLQVVYDIPYGSLRTYGEIAKELGTPKAARAIGAALGANPLPILIPCHRVIGSDHHLRGYSGGLQRKAFLLKLEGHRIKNERIIT